VHVKTHQPPTEGNFFDERGYTYKCLRAVRSLDFILHGQKSFYLLDLTIQNSWIPLSSSDWISH